MALYAPSQDLYHQNENVWDDTIKCQVENDEFIAVTDNSIEEGATQRNITVTVMNLPDSDTLNVQECNTGAYVRQEGEASVKVTVVKNGETVGENTADYPA